MSENPKLSSSSLLFLILDNNLHHAQNKIFYEIFAKWIKFFLFIFIK